MQTAGIAVPHGAQSNSLRLQKGRGLKRWTSSLTNSWFGCQRHVHLLLLGTWRIRLLPLPQAIGLRSLCGSFFWQAFSFYCVNVSHWAQAATWLWWIGGRVALPKPCLNPEPIESLTKSTTFEPGSVNWTLLDQQTARQFLLVFLLSLCLVMFSKVDHHVSEYLCRWNIPGWNNLTLCFVDEISSDHFLCSWDSSGVKKSYCIWFYPDSSARKQPDKTTLRWIKLLNRALKLGSKVVLLGDLETCGSMTELSCVHASIDFQKRYHDVRPV